MQKTSKWEMLELSFYSDRKVSNPFTEVSFGAEFICGSRKLKADGFYDGEEDGKNVWRVRFAPMWEGIWNYRTISDDSTLNGITGEFECTHAVSRGGLTTDPHFPGWFVREDGSYQMIVNEGWYPHPCNGFDREYERRDYKQPGEEDMKLYLQMLADHKVNMVVDIGQLYARQTSVTDPTFRWPWKVLDAEHNKFDKDFFNLDYYQRMDRMMQFALEHEIFFAMEMLYDNSVVRPREWSHHPLNIDNGGWLQGNEAGTGWRVMFDLDNKEHMKYMERYVKYTVARFSAYRNLLWSIGSENGNLIEVGDDILPNSSFPKEKAAAWYNYWGDFIARKDPYGRLRSFGDTGYLPGMLYSPHNNFIITQDPRGNYYPKGDIPACYRAMNRFGENYWHYGRPVVVGEMTAGTVGKYDVERRLYWIGFVSGIHMGRADRHFGPVIDGQLVESEIFGFEGVPVIYEDMKRLADFVEDRKIAFERMRPNDSLLGGVTDEDMIFCLAAEGEEYVVYFVNGKTAELTLPAAEYEWYNPRTGESKGKAALEAGCHKFTAPDEEDWVLYAVRSGC